MKLFFVASSAVWLAGCTIVRTDAPVPNGEATIYVVDRGWHTDIALPIDEVTGPLASLVRDLPDVRFVVFGFGERNFYMARGPGSGEMLAALLPSDSVILMTPLMMSPAEAFANQEVVLLHLTRSGVQRIAMRLWNELEKTSDGSVLRLADGPFAGSAFYASNETYGAFHTCNTWTALLLHDGGLPVNTHVLFAGQAMEEATRIAIIQAR